MKEAQEGSIAIEAAFVLSLLFFITIAVIDIASTAYAKLQLSAAVHTGIDYAMTGYNIPGRPFPDVIAISQHTGLPGVALQLIQEQCYVCNNGKNICVPYNSACKGGTLFAMNKLTGRYVVPLFLHYPGLAHPFYISESVYFPAVPRAVDESPDNNF